MAADLVIFIIAAFGVYRMARMIVEEEGPFAVFVWLRGVVDPDQRTWIGRGINCFYCVSFWIALIATLAIGAAWWWWLGLAGAAIWLYGQER